MKLLKGKIFRLVHSVIGGFPTFYPMIFGEENSNFELYIFAEAKKGGIISEKVRHEIEKDLNLLDITATDLQDEILGPTFNDKKGKKVSKRVKNDKYMEILAGFTSSIVQYFESYLRTDFD